MTSLSIQSQADEIFALLAKREIRTACETQGCIAPAPFRCAWPVEREVVVPARTLEVGDVWVTEQTRKHGRIVRIEKTIRLDFPLRFHVMIPGFGKAPCTYDRHPDIGKGVITLRPAPCGAYACEQHVREVDPARHYCQAHWRSWEGVS